MCSVLSKSAGTQHVTGVQRKKTCQNSRLHIEVLRQLCNDAYSLLVERNFSLISLFFIPQHKVSRDGLFAQAEKLIQELGSSHSVLEIHYEGEV